MRTSPYTFFGETFNVPVVTYTDGRLDAEPRSTWTDEIWVARGEDYYAIPSKGTVRVIERDEWLKARRRAER